MNRKIEWEKEKQKVIDKTKKDYGFDIKVVDLDDGEIFISIIENDLSRNYFETMKENLLEKIWGEFYGY